MSYSRHRRDEATHEHQDSDNRSKYDESLSNLTADAIRYNQAGKLSFQTTPIRSKLTWSTIGDSTGDLQRVNGAVNSSRAFISSQNREGSQEKEQTYASRRTFRHQIPIPPLERQKRMSHNRGDYVYEAIAQKPAVPSWLQTLAESPAREAREYRPRPDAIEFTLNDEGDIFKKEAATHRNYMPPHYEPLSGDIVDPKYWKHNKRPDAHPIPEAKKRRIEVHSSEIPHLDQDFRPDREHRKKQRESSKGERERHHKHKRERSRRRAKRHSSSDEEDARPPNSFLAKEGAQIRENPAIVAGGSAVIDRRRAPRTPPYIRDLERQASPSYPRSDRRADLRNFRYQEARPSAPSPIRPISSIPFSPIPVMQTPPIAIPQFRPVPSQDPLPGVVSMQAVNQQPSLPPSNIWSPASRTGFPQNVYMNAQPSQAAMVPQAMPFSSVPMQPVLARSGIQQTQRDVYADKMAQSIPELRASQYQPVASAPPMPAKLNFMERDQQTMLARKDEHMRALVLGESASAAGAVVSDASAQRYPPSESQQQARQISQQSTLPNILAMGASSTFAHQSGSNHEPSVAGGTVIQPGMPAMAMVPSNNTPAACDFRSKGNFVLPTSMLEKPVDHRLASERLHNADDARKRQNITSDGIEQGDGGPPSSSTAGEIQTNLERWGQQKYARHTPLTLSRKGSGIQDNARDQERDSPRISMEEITSSILSRRASPAVTRHSSGISAMPIPGISRAGSQASMGQRSISKPNPQAASKNRPAPTTSSSPRAANSTSSERNASSSNLNSDNSAVAKTPSTPNTSVSNRYIGGKHKFDLHGMKGF